MLAAPIIGVDTESNGEDIRDGRGYLTGSSVAFRHVNGLVYSHYFPFRHRIGFNYGQDIRGEFTRILETRDKVRYPSVYFNAPFDLLSLGTLGVKLENDAYYCALLMTHLISEERPFHKSLENVSMHWLKYPGKEESAEFKAVRDKLGWDHIPSEMMYEYAANDAEVVLRIHEHIKPKFDKEPKLAAYWEGKKQTIRVFQAMESRGILVDKVVCERQLAHADITMEEIAFHLGVNPGSPKGLEELLINQLKLPILERTPTGRPRFTKDEMEQYDEMLEFRDDPTAEMVLAYRGWQKAASACYGAYLKYCSPDGRVRPHYKLHGTKTGRCSCVEPNLQQIPKTSDKPWNGDVKRSFKAEDEYELWEADYSQLEFRLGTAYAKEPSLIQCFAEGRDIFDEMTLSMYAGLFVGLEPGTPELLKTFKPARQRVKTKTYSIQYGAGVNRIKNVFGITEAEARREIDQYYETYPRFKQVTEMCKKSALKNGYVALWSGRRRHFTDAKKAAHKAFNAVQQGGAADIVEAAMRELFRTVNSNECRMLLQVHDSIVFEIRRDKVPSVLPEIKRIMEDVDGCTGQEFGVKFAVDCHRWGE